MRVGRFGIGIIRGKWDFGYEQYNACGCRVLSIGPIYFMWSGKDCKCMTCQQYECKCGGFE